jgi:uncharacterized protein
VVFLIEVLLFLSSILTAILSAVVGMAGGITLLSIMTFFMPLEQIVPLHGAVQFVSNSTRSYSLRKKVKWPVIGYYLMGLPLGTLVAVYFIKSFDSTKFATILVIILIWYVVFKPKKLPQVKIPIYGFFFVSSLVGFLNPFIGATGPMQASFFLRDDWTKEEIVATKAVSQALGHLLKFPAFLFLGYNYLKDWELILIMCIGVVVGTQLGLKVLYRIDERVFRLIYRTALFLASVRLALTLY